MYKLTAKDILKVKDAPAGNVIGQLAKGQVVYSSVDPVGLWFSLTGGGWVSKGSSGQYLTVETVTDPEPEPDPEPDPEPTPSIVRVVSAVVIFELSDGSLMEQTLQ